MILSAGSTLMVEPLLDVVDPSTIAPVARVRECGRRFAESHAQRPPGVPLADQRRGCGG